LPQETSFPADQRHGLSDQPDGGVGERLQHVDAQRPCGPAADQGGRAPAGHVQCPRRTYCQGRHEDSGLPTTVAPAIWQKSEPSATLNQDQAGLRSRERHHPRQVTTTSGFVVAGGPVAASLLRCLHKETWQTTQACLSFTRPTGIGLWTRASASPSACRSTTAISPPAGTLFFLRAAGGRRRSQQPRLIKLNTAPCRTRSASMGRCAGIAGGAWRSWRGNRIAARASEPIALAYAGHQFRQPSCGSLGDGPRRPWLGEGRGVATASARDTSSSRVSGPTPFLSRRGDGNGPGPGVRCCANYIISEGDGGAWHSHDAVAGGRRDPAEPVMARDGAPRRGADAPWRRATSASAPSSFFAAPRRHRCALRLLADFVIDRHYPPTPAGEGPRPYPRPVSTA